MLNLKYDDADYEYDVNSFIIRRMHAHKYKTTIFSLKMPPLKSTCVFYVSFNFI